MASTQQKNVTAPYSKLIRSAGAVFDLETHLLDRWSTPSSDTMWGSMPRRGLLSDVLGGNDGSERAARLAQIFPDLRTAPILGRDAAYGCFIRSFDPASVFTGNQAVYRFLTKILDRTWGVISAASSPLNAAVELAPQIANLTASTSYLRGSTFQSVIERQLPSKACLTLLATTDNISRLWQRRFEKRHHKQNTDFCRSLLAAFNPAFARANLTHSKAGEYIDAIQGWGNQRLLEASPQYSEDDRELQREAASSTAARREWRRVQVRAKEERRRAIAQRGARWVVRDPPELKTRELRPAKRSKPTTRFYASENALYIWIQTPRDQVESECMGDQEFYREMCDPEHLSDEPPQGRRRRLGELYVLLERDIEDLQSMLRAEALIRWYPTAMGQRLRSAEFVKPMGLAWKEYTRLRAAILLHCGKSYEDRNKCGAYFDVLNWRYLASLSGNKVVDHSKDMAKKIQSGEMEHMPSQDKMLELLDDLPPDIGLDITGLYKCSLYPELCPFQVILDQRELHLNPLNTDWEEGSPEALRFADTRAYMWYFGYQVMKDFLKREPGVIREGATEKCWHANYPIAGLPSKHWRDAEDIDLSGTMPIPQMTNMAYMQQADSSCCPPDEKAYLTGLTYAKEPRYNKRKILYILQNPEPTDLGKLWDKLCAEQDVVPSGYTGVPAWDPGVVWHTGTGTRCERQKKNPRPFYQMAPAWGCLTSHVNTYTRDFLGLVKQSALGSSTLVKVEGFRSAVQHKAPGCRTLLVSDDKKKYSPHMDANSQQMSYDFFAEVSGVPQLRNIGPLMYHSKLYYRAHGHLVYYHANGTDREGLRAGANTWLEIVAQGLSTRLCRERQLLGGPTVFSGFIDDALRALCVTAPTPEIADANDKLVLADIVFGLRCVGRELSWDKAFVSHKMATLLNEITIEGHFYVGSGKCISAFMDREFPEVLDAAALESYYFGKAKGARSSALGGPASYILYLLFTVWEFMKFLQLHQYRSHQIPTPWLFAMFAITPVCEGGLGVRSIAQLEAPIGSSISREGNATLCRAAINNPVLRAAVYNLIHQVPRTKSPLEFMRAPDYACVHGPRIKSQRVIAAVRQQMGAIARNMHSRDWVSKANVAEKSVSAIGKTIVALPRARLDEILRIYESSPAKMIDELCQKISGSQSVASLLNSRQISRLRTACKKDAYKTVSEFPLRIDGVYTLHPIRALEIAV